MNNKRSFLRHSMSVFFNRAPTNRVRSTGMSSSIPLDRIRTTRRNERSIITSVCNHIAMSVAAISMEHVQLDDNRKYKETLDTSLNRCLTVEANVDQIPYAFFQEAVMTMLERGVVALVPTRIEGDIYDGTAFEIHSLRVGEVVEWYPKAVKVSVYNEDTGTRLEWVYPKKAVAIIQNPFYAVMNEPNSTLQRLTRKLNLLDLIDEQSGSGKLDLIIQLPYVIRNEAKRAEAEKRRKDIEDQLSGSKYGIAYTDGTEHITQLNRSVENNLLKQIEYLHGLLFSELGVDQSVFNGTANEPTMLNYFNNVIEPIVSAFTSEMSRKWITPTARTQRKTIMAYRDPFKLVPTSQLAELADKFTRNEIMTSNEFRQVIGMKRANDPKADELRNKNLSVPEDHEVVPIETEGD